MGATCVSRGLSECSESRTTAPIGAKPADDGSRTTTLGRDKLADQAPQACAGVGLHTCQPTARKAEQKASAFVHRMRSRCAEALTRTGRDQRAGKPKPHCQASAKSTSCKLDARGVYTDTWQSSYRSAHLQLPKLLPECRMLEQQAHSTPLTGISPVARAAGPLSRRQFGSVMPGKASAERPAGRGQRAGSLPPFLGRLPPWDGAPLELLRKGEFSRKPSAEKKRDLPAFCPKRRCFHTAARFLISTDLRVQAADSGCS